MERVEIGHRTGGANAAAIFGAILIFLALAAYGINKYIHAQPCAEQHVTKECKR